MFRGFFSRLFIYILENGKNIFEEYFKDFDFEVLLFSLSKNTFLKFDKSTCFI